MAWTAPRTWVVGEVLTAALLNTHVRDNFNVASVHAHDGTAGEGNDQLTGIDDIIFDDLAAPAAPGASKSRLYVTSAGPRVRRGAAGTDDPIAPTVKGGLLTFSTKLVELAVGSNKQIIEADSAEVTGLKYVFPERYLYGRMAHPFESLTGYSVTTALSGTVTPQGGGVNLLISNQIGSKAYLKSLLTDNGKAAFGATYEIWLKVSIVGGLNADKQAHIILGNSFDAVLGVQKAMGFFLDAANFKVYSADGVTAQTTTVTFTSGALYVARWTGTQCLFYKDGVLIATHATNVPDGNSLLQIRSLNNATTSTMQDVFQEVEVITVLA